MKRTFRLVSAMLLACAPAIQAAENAPAGAHAVDFRFAPPSWQTAICLPDDWQKTLVSKDGALLYDYPGPVGGFTIRIAAGPAGGTTEWIRQELLSPRVPVVRTTLRRHDLECVTEAFAVPAPEGQAGFDPTIERIGEPTTLTGWAAPIPGFDPAFADIAVGWNRPVRYRLRADASGRYAIIFGLCEGHHTAGRQRVLDLQVEGKTRHTADPISERGRNVPVGYRVDASDENGDGFIEIAVAAAAGTPDTNTILNVLWVFPADACPSVDEVIAGRHNDEALAYVPCGTGPAGPPHDDVLRLELGSPGGLGFTVVPTLTIETPLPVTAQAGDRQARVGGQTTVLCSEPFVRADRFPDRTVLVFKDARIPAGGRHRLAFGVHRGRGRAEGPNSTDEAGKLLRQARTYWEKLDLPYDRIRVPDAGVQALLDSSTRNIYQAREIRKGLPAFQVGPTCYRGLWVVDGSFVLEAVAYLGRLDEARRGIDYLLGFQRPDGGFMLLDRHWKETGIVLWAVTRHARLTGDRQWLAAQWPRVEKGLAYIRQLRQTASSDPAAPNAGLIPAGFSDGGLSGPAPEYTNVYWTMVGLKAAADAARWLGREAQADEWRREYEDLYATFRRAAERDAREDGDGNRYVPILMTGAEKVLPQRAQWAFLHAVFPGRLFATDDPLVRGNMAMLRAAECEGLVLTTGWLDDGIWNYFGSFYAHAWLWLGQRDKAIETFYAFANHASPLLCWREEQRPVGRGSQVVGDMPHNWASAEFIRLVRHMLVLERGDELHLLEGLPAGWVRPGARTSLKEIQTDFGPVTMELAVSDDGAEAILRLAPPARTPPRRIVLHLDGWSGREGTEELSTSGPIERSIPLKR